MSESLQEQWSAEGDLQYHKDRANEAMAVMQRELILPADKRWQYGYGLMATGGGQDSGVISLGTYGTMKTTAGNLMLGPDQRISVNSTDTEATLFGHNHPNPTNGSPRFIKGKFDVVDPSNPVFFLNELSHMRNQKPVQQLWDGKELVLGEDKINLQDAVYYVTGNYPNGRDVHRLSPSILSRMGAELLTGDVDDQTARRIQSVSDVSFEQAPIMPSSDARKALHELVVDAYPNPENNGSGTVTGNLTVDLIARLNESGLVAPISSADARIGKALAAASRAYLFAHGRETGTKIHPIVVARVAALVLPTVVSLSAKAESNMQDYIDRPVGDLDKAIAARRIIAREAFRTAYQRLAEDDASEEGEEGAGALSMLSKEAIEHRVDERVEKFSYANAEVLGYDIDQAIAGSTRAVTAPTTKRRRGLRDLRNRHNQ